MRGGFSHELTRIDTNFEERHGKTRIFTDFDEFAQLQFARLAEKDARFCLKIRLPSSVKSEV